MEFVSGTLAAMTAFVLKDSLGQTVRQALITVLMSLATTMAVVKKWQTCKLIVVTAYLGILGNIVSHLLMCAAQILVKTMELVWVTQLGLRALVLPVSQELSVTLMLMFVPHFRVITMAPAQKTLQGTHVTVQETLLG